MEMHCDKCKIQMPSSAKFCPKCGEPAQISSETTLEEKQQNICSKCGTINPSEAKYCKKDGFSLLKQPEDLYTQPASLPKINPTIEYGSTAPLDSPAKEPPFTSEELEEVSGFENNDTDLTADRADVNQARKDEERPDRSSQRNDVDTTADNRSAMRKRPIKLRFLSLAGASLVFILIGAYSGWYYFSKNGTAVQPQSQNNMPAVTTTNTNNSMDRQPVSKTEPITSIIEPLDSSKPLVARQPIAREKTERAISKKSQDPVRLEGEMNRALRNAGVGSVTAEVSNNMEATLKGTAQSNQDKERAISIARSFNNIVSVKNLIFVISIP